MTPLPTSLTPEATKKLEQIDTLRDKINDLHHCIKHHIIHPVNAFHGGISLPKCINKIDYEYIVEKTLEIKKSELHLAEIDLIKILNTNL